MPWSACFFATFGRWWPPHLLVVLGSECWEGCERFHWTTLRWGSCIHFVWTNFACNDQIQIITSFFLKQRVFHNFDGVGCRGTWISIIVLFTAPGLRRLRARAAWNFCCTEAFALATRFSQVTMLGSLPVVVSLALLIVPLGWHPPFTPWHRHYLYMYINYRYK